MGKIPNRVVRLLMKHFRLSTHSSPIATPHFVILEAARDMYLHSRSHRPYNGLSIDSIVRDFIIVSIVCAPARKVSGFRHTDRRKGNSSTFTQTFLLGRHARRRFLSKTMSNNGASSLFSPSGVAHFVIPFTIRAS